MKKRDLLLWSFLIVTSSTGCFGHLVYPSDTYQGKVIDDETKEPIAGAVILAIWYHEAPGLGGHGPAESYHDALEVLTDAQGEFTVPAKTHLTAIGKIREPEFVIYYPGYGYYSGFQVHPVGKEIEAAYEQRFFHVELRKLKTREEKLRNLDARPARVPIEKMLNLTKLLNVEAINLGLSPLPVPGGR
ncbi:MAG: hypothetical protein HYY11_02560 [Candidatus Methylomirabilis oxyfera]|nr:hypothetical protein [Candidatus Methylomirabilis oxyfera]